jgi:CubicO group peptidase (beta-lactamase class C family)
MTADPAGSVRAEVDAYLARKGVGSVSIAIARGGAGYCYAAGDAAPGRPADAQTVYEIGSVSKTFTGLLLAEAALAGRLGLEDEVRTRLEETYSNLAFETHPVRLVHLATMTSGLPDNLPPRPTTEAGSPRDRAFARAEVLEAYTSEAFLSELRGAVVSVEPGTSPSHSNAAAELLGLILARSSGRPFADLVETGIEAPAGMEGGSSTQVAAASLNLQGETMPYLTAPMALASGGLRYSAADMLRYARWHLNEADPAVRLSHQPQWKTLDEKMGIALGWIWHSESPVGRRLRASGGSFGFASFLDVYPDAQTAVVALTNGADDPTQGELQTLSESIVGLIAAAPDQTWAQGLGDCR